MQDLYQRPRSPFDDSALERLRRMGLADTDGHAVRDVMTIFACIFAGQFYDDLRDYYQDHTDIQELMTQLFDAAETAESKQKFLLICLQYDGMFRELPDPVWWISGQPEFAELFADGFLVHLKLLNDKSKEEPTT